MGIFNKREMYKNKKDNNFLRIKIAAFRAGISDSNMRQGSAVINADEEWSFNEFIKIIIQKYCPKVADKGATWILVYQDKSLAVFNSGSGNINIINDKLINISMKELIGNDNAPQIFLYYIGEKAIEESTKTMIGI
ncbi:MAG TPA: hypothetical protein DG753_09440 [Clostridium sp.]|nr:hypothetical protein [Clostridium sp.]